MWILVKVTQVTLVVDGKDELRLVLARASNCVVLRRVRLVLMTLFVSCRASRIHLHELHVSTLHSIRIHIVHLARSLHDVHVARCVQNSMNSLGDGAVRGRGVCVLWRNKVTEYEYSDWGQAFCCVWVRSYTADAFEVACRDVGRPFVVTRARRFSGKWKSYRGVLFTWLVHVLMSHLGQAE